MHRMHTEKISISAIRVLTDKFQPKNQVITKIAIEVIVLILSVSVFIVGGIMVTANSAGQILTGIAASNAEFIMFVFQSAGCLMVLYCMERLGKWIKELKEGNKWKFRRRSLRHHHFLPDAGI